MKKQQQQQTKLFVIFYQKIKTFSETTFFQLVYATTTFHKPVN